MLQYDDSYERWAGIAIITLLILVIIFGSCCTYEKEVQATISVGQVVKVEQLQNRYLIKVKDINDSVIYADYFSKTPLTTGELILIIVKR